MLNDEGTRFKICQGKWELLFFKSVVFKIWSLDQKHQQLLGIVFGNENWWAS